MGAHTSDNSLVNNPILLCKGKEFQEKGAQRGKLAVL